MSSQYAIIFDNEKCIQCHGCQVACKSWRNVEFGVAWRRVENAWAGRYPEIKSSSVVLACMHCVEPACVAICPEDALSKRAKDGVVLVDAEKCIGCRSCLEECPFGIPQFGESETMQKCDLCNGYINYKQDKPPCVATCPTGALGFKKVNVQEIVFLEKRMKELLKVN